MSHVDKNNQSGFTIIELILAMTFVSLLLMAIAMTVIQIGGMYNKGMTLKAVDQAGRSVSEELQRSIGASKLLDLGPSGVTGTSYIRQVIPGSSDLNDPDGGRLCTGAYSYIWNTGKGLVNPVNKYTGDEARVLRLVKVADNGGLYCSTPAMTVDPASATELLSAGDREMALQNFTIVPVAEDPTIQQAIYRITMEIGTNDRAALYRPADIDTVDTACVPPSDSASQKDFCAVNKFEFTARAGNRGEN